MATHIRALIGILFSLTLLTGCPSSNSGCGHSFTVTFNGKIVDSIGNPIANVNVDSIGPDGERGLITTTDANGNYVYNWYRAIPLKNLSLAFYKTGFQEVITPRQTYGSDCGDQTATNNATLVP